MSNLARLAEASIDRHGDYRSLCFEGTWHTSGEEHRRATCIAGGLRDLGVRPGDRVAVVMANCPEVSQVYQAVWRAGAIVTPVVFLVTADDRRRHAVVRRAAGSRCRSWTAAPTSSRRCCTPAAPPDGARVSH